MSERAPREGRARRAWVLLAWLVAAQGAFAAEVAGGFEAPKVAVERLRIERLDKDDLRIAVTLSIDNPTDRAIELQGVDFAVDVAQFKVGSGSLAEPVVLPARGRTSAEVHARASPSALASAFVATLDKREIEYSVSGLARIDGAIVPFVRRGRQGVDEFFARSP